MDGRVSPPSGWSEIGDGQSAVLENGTYMLGNCCTSDQALLRRSVDDVDANRNRQARRQQRGRLDAAANGDVLTADVIASPNSEVYVPSANTWQIGGNLPVNLVTQDEIGPQTHAPE